MCRSERSARDASWMSVLDECHARGSTKRSPLGSGRVPALRMPVGPTVLSRTSALSRCGATTGGEEDRQEHSQAHNGAVKAVEGGTPNARCPRLLPIPPTAIAAGLLRGATSLRPAEHQGSKTWEVRHRGTPSSGTDRISSTRESWLCSSAIRSSFSRDAVPCRQMKPAGRLIIGSDAWPRAVPARRSVRPAWSAFSWGAAGNAQRMDPKLAFFFYLAAVVCFGLAAFSPVSPGLGRTGRGLGARVGLVPLGLGLWLFPTMWTTGTSVF